MKVKIEMLIHWLRPYPQHLLTPFIQIISPSVNEWAQRTLVEIKRHFRTHPTDHLVINVGSLTTNYQINGDQLWILLVMVRNRNEPKTAELLCIIGPPEAVYTEKDFLLKSLERSALMHKCTARIIDFSKMATP
jgi:hypothetical protein